MRVKVSQHLEHSLMHQCLDWWKRCIKLLIFFYIVPTVSVLDVHLYSVTMEDNHTLALTSQSHLRKKGGWRMLSIRLCNIFYTLLSMRKTLVISINCKSCARVRVLSGCYDHLYLWGFSSSVKY